jgi:hypothetical protein
MRKYVPQRGQPQTPPPPQQMNVDIASARDVVCENCGNWTFQEAALLKHLSEIQSPTGKAGYVPVPVFTCLACGHINFDFLPPWLKEQIAERIKNQPTQDEQTEQVEQPQVEKASVSKLILDI